MTNAQSKLFITPDYVPYAQLMRQSQNMFMHIKKGEYICLMLTDKDRLGHNPAMRRRPTSFPDGENPALT